MVIAKWKKIPKEEFEQFVRESRSIRELAGKIGYHPDGGGTARSLKEAIKFYGCDISHFLGQSWQKENYDYSQFEFGTVKKNSSSSARVLIKLRGHRCEVCGLTTWLEKPITLIIKLETDDPVNVATSTVVTAPLENVTTLDVVAVNPVYAPFE